MLSVSSGWVMTDEPETAKTRLDCAGGTSADSAPASVFPP